MGEFSHFAYCSGPMQLSYLLSALHVCGISSSDCTVLPFTRSAKNDEVEEALSNACSHLGLQTANAACLPSLGLNTDCLYQSGTSQARRTVFWYCRGGPGTGFWLTQVQKIMPDVVCEYYDGFRSPIVALVQVQSTLSLSDVTCLGDLRQLAVQRLMRPDRYFMPDDGLWEKYVPAEVQMRTHYMPLKVTRDKIKVVGEILEEGDTEKHIAENPGVVLLTGMFSERQASVSLGDELNMYSDILKVVHSVSGTATILVKSHPRASPEKMRRLEAICVKYNARLHTRQQLVEYILEKSGRRDVAVIGPHSTALLSTIQFGYGRAFCPSQQLMASYVGPEYARDPWMTRDHELMEVAGVNMVDSLQQLRDLL